MYLLLNYTYTTLTICFHAYLFPCALEKDNFQLELKWPLFLSRWFLLLLSWVCTLFWNRLRLLGSICKVLPLIVASYEFSLFLKTQAQHKSTQRLPLTGQGKFQSPACAREEVRSPRRSMGFKASAVALPSQHFSKWSRGTSVVGLRKPWTSEDCRKLPWPYSS